MSELERKLAGDGLVITGELPVVDGGGLDAVRAEARAVRAVGRRRQRDRQHRRARARVQRRGRDRAEAARRRADHAGRLPRQEPPRDPGRHRRRRAARHREHLLPDRRRRDGGRRAGGPPGLRPRRPAGDRHGRGDRARRVPLGPQDRAGAAPLHRRRREPGRTAARLPRAARAQEGARGRPLPAAADLLRARAPRGVLRRGRAHRALRAHGAPAVDLPGRRRAAARVHGRRRAGHLGARARRSSASRPPPIRATRRSSWQSNRPGTPSHSRACAACTSSRSARTTRSGACASASAFPKPRSETRVDTVLQSRSKTVTIAIDKPFCIIGERINPTGRKAFAQELRDGNLDRGARGRGRADRRWAPTCSTSTPASRWSTRPSCSRTMIRLVQDHTDIAALHRLLGDRGARGRARRLRGQGARQLGDRRGRPPRADPPDRRQARRGRDRPRQRRDRHSRDRREAARDRAQDRLGRRRPRHPARGRA